MRIAIHDYAGHPFQYALSRELARRGHVVRHFFFQGDAGPKGVETRRDDDPTGFDVEPIAITEPYRKDQLLKRRAQDIEYGRKAGARIANFRPDVVLSGNTPLEAQASILAASRRCGAAFVFWMQDVYSLAIRSFLAGRLAGAGSLAAFWYERLEASLLNRSDAIVLVSDDFLASLKALRVTGAVEVIPNWGPLHEVPMRPKTTPWAKARGLSDKFVFLYSGTLGLKHDPLLLTALADEFADDPNVTVVVAATGAGAERLRQALNQSPRPNLLLKGLEPIENLPEALGAADVMVALLEPDAGRFSAPSKVLSYLCAGKPTLLSAPGGNIAARLLETARAGRSVEAGDRAAFMAAARELRAAPAACQALGASGRAFAQANFEIGPICDRFTGVLEQAVARGRAEHRRAA